ncbi:MAG TPA: Do family serine endopeptidase [Rhizobiaceae bacterium]|nr:Do family serine endopeptidase [Rhizobiaceae bacterium]
MNKLVRPSGIVRKRFLAAAATIALCSAVGYGVVATTTPVFADPVYVAAQSNVPSFADLVAKVSPAVVSVRVESRVQPTSDDGSDFFSGPGWDQLPDNSPLKRFFRDFEQEQGHHPAPHQNQGKGRLRPTAQGSGFFISDDGYVVTNNHVVQGAQAFTVVLNDGTELKAKLVGTDPRTDLAVLKVNNPDRKFTYLSWADDSKVRVGDWTLAVGNPFGLGGTVTAGIVSARGRDIGAGPYDDFIQIDAPVNHGNSGGPSLNLNGQVIGINTAIFSPSGGSVGIAFAIPASTAKTVVQDLIKNGQVSRGWLGVEIQPVTKDIAESLGISNQKGALVSEAQEGPAKSAGVKTGDIITAVNGKEVDSPKDLARMIGEMSPNKQVALSVWRDGKTQSINVTLGKMPASTQMASNDQQNNNNGATQNSSDTLNKLGLTVTPSDNGQGLVVTNVESNSDASDKGIHTGDVIVAVNSKQVNSAADVDKATAEAVKEGRKAILLQIRHDKNNRFVALPVGNG